MLHIMHILRPYVHYMTHSVAKVAGFEPAITVLETVALDQTKLHLHTDRTGDLVGYAQSKFYYLLSPIASLFACASEP